jgi:nucleoside-triphosphatase THEP1
LFAKLIPRLLHKTKSKYAADINDAVKMFPSFKAISHAAWQQSSDKKGLKKVFTFVGNLITWCVLYKEEVEEKGTDIIIFSKPIHSGKTTELQLWSNGKKNIAGILMPDINYKRKMQNIATGEIFDAEINDVATPDNQIEMIGTYVFYAAAFKKANHILCNATAQNPDWIIIDEVGKLEMTEGGFYKSVKYILENKGCHTKLLLVVRDGLVNNVIDFFKISNYRIADNSRSF